MKMKIKRVVTLYFSPTHATQKVIRAAAKGLGVSNILELDRTSFDSRWTGAALQTGDVAVIGMPVYYGRAPKILVEFFRYIEAQEIPAVIISVYGNRDYEDALLELIDESRKHGFLPIAAGAFIGQHSFSDKLGTGRPDNEDIAKAEELGRWAASFISEHTDLSAVKLEVKGSFPYTPGSDLPIAPVTDIEKCRKCMDCQKKCPVQAINPLNPVEVDAWRCLNCAKCILECPVGAKSIDNPAMKEKIMIMEAMFTEPKQTELFYAR